MGLEPTFLLGKSGEKITTATGNEQIERAVEAALQAALPGVDLREVNVDRRADMLCIVIDHPNGVTHELCADATHALDATGLRETFGVEVSSPGPEPPLRTPEHYLAALGATVALKVAVDGRERAASITGTLTEVTPDQIQVGTSEGHRWISTGAIRRGRLVERSTV